MSSWRIERPISSSCKASYRQFGSRPFPLTLLGTFGIFAARPGLSGRCHPLPGEDSYGYLRSEGGWTGSYPQLLSLLLLNYLSSLFMPHLPLSCPYWCSACLMRPRRQNTISPPWAPWCLSFPAHLEPLFVEEAMAVGSEEGPASRGQPMIMLPAVLVLFFFGDFLLGLLKGEYRSLRPSENHRPLQLQWPHSLFIPIQNVRMRVESILKLNAVRCFLLLGLSYALVSRFGILGAGYAWMATYLVIVLWVGRVALRERWL